MLLASWLPPDAACARVYGMSGHLRPLADTLAQGWAALTGGELAIAVGDRPLVGPLARTSLPKAVARCLEQRTSLRGYRTRSRSWWVTQPMVATTTPVQLVAWAREEGHWGEQLQRWAGLLADSVEADQTTTGLTDELINAWDRLSFLYELTQVAGRHGGVDEMLRDVVRLLAQVVSSEDVFLVTAQLEGLSCVTASGQPLPLPEVLAACVAGAPRPLTLGELRATLDRAGSPLAEAGDLLLAPLQAGGGHYGVIGLIDPPGQHFDANDAYLLASVAEQVSSLIDAARANEARLESERLEHELAIAAELQTSLLPVGLPELPGLELAAYLQAARRVGGDLYEVVQLESGGTMLLLADVAGKGMPAALLTALVHALFVSECTHRRDPAQLLEDMNGLIFGDLDRAETFVTAAVARLETEPPRFCYASAGHVDIALWRDRPENLEFLPATGLPLGVEPGVDYQSREMPLEPGDVLLLYSDGITEAEDETGKMLSMQGLSDIIYAAHPAAARDQVGAILEGLEAHRGDLPLEDDVALLLVRCLPQATEPILVKPFVIRSEVEAVGRLLELVREVCESPNGCGSPPGRGFADDFALALSEIVVNQVQHAYRGRAGRIHGRLTLGRGSLEADLYDDGIVFRRREARGASVDVEDPPDRGYGLLLARGLLDRCDYHRLTNRNHWRLVKRR